MSTARKIFIANVTLPPIVATSLLSMMINSALHWGYETTALTTPSLDSITGSEAGIVSSATVYIGSDSNVRDVAGTDTYKGVTVPAGQNYSLQDFGSTFGVIDPSTIYFYNQSGCGVDLTFQAR